MSDILSCVVNDISFAIIGFYIPFVMCLGELSCFVNMDRSKTICRQIDNMVTVYGFIVVIAGWYFEPIKRKIKNISWNTIFVISIGSLSALTAFHGIEPVRNVYFKGYFNFILSLELSVYLFILWGSYLDEQYNKSIFL